jgi:hypothetical protein
LNFIITPENQFSVTCATAQRKDKKIQTAEKLVVFVMSRARNTGMLIEETNRSFIASPVFR